MLRWPVTSGRAIARLFRSVQNLDIFVEDQGDEAFYLVLFRTAAPSGISISRVVGLGGREAVLEAARTHQAPRPALFLIDGDFPWVRGDEMEKLGGLFQLESYCIENLLLSASLVHQILAEEAICEEEGASDLFDFPAWLARVAVLVPLAVRLAVLNRVVPSRATIGKVFGTVVVAGDRGLPSLDAGKVSAAIEAAENEIFTAVGVDEGRRMIEEVAERVARLRDPLRAVSGKSLLLPLLHFEIKRISDSKVTRDVFRYRLAKKCKAEDLSDIRDALGAVT